MDAPLTNDVADALGAAGHRIGEVLGAGMEGVVVALGPDLVAKVWYARPVADLQRLQVFYDAVARSGPVIATPRIVDVLDVGGRGVSVERRLRGSPLEGTSGIVPVLAALRSVSVAPDMAVLPPLPGEDPFDPAVPFATSLARLVERRVTSALPVLTARLPDVERVTASVVSALEALPAVRPALLHGDLVPANVLVDRGASPTAVLDFGFLSTVGDPRFDAAVAAGIFDMYGPGARATEATLDRSVVEAFGDDPSALHLYRAAYALVTSTAYSASGSDGHFTWCVDLLGRADVREAIAQPRGIQPDDPRSGAKSESDPFSVRTENRSAP